MGKSRRAGVLNDGPYLDTACFCEQVVQEKDGTYSIIRLVNRITFWSSDVQPGIKLIMPLSLFISFKAGNVNGERELFLFQTTPSGKRGLMEYEWPLAITFQGDDTGKVVVVPGLIVRFESNGTYWIDIQLGKKIYTRLPLTISHSEEPDPTSNRFEGESDGR